MLWKVAEFCAVMASTIKEPMMATRRRYQSQGKDLGVVLSVV